METAKHSRWDRPFTALTYEPMQEVLRYLRANNYKTHILTGGCHFHLAIVAEL